MFLKNRSASVVCVWVLPPTEDDLDAFEGQWLQWVRGLASPARASASGLFLVPSSQSFGGMLRQVPQQLSQTGDEGRISAAASDSLL